MTNESDDNADVPAAVRERTLRDKLSTPSWILYDFSDTIFSASILTIYFPLWVTQDAGGTDAYFAFALSLSALLVAITAPMAGAVSDQINRRVPMLAFCVLLCAVCTGLIGAFGGLSGGLALFFFANFLYQTGLVFYNSLLRNVSSESGRGIVSGIGVGAGYVGLFVAFLLLDPQVEKYGNQWAFLPTAGLYVLFALPLLLIVKDVGRMRSITRNLIGESYKQLYATLRNARRHKNLFRFLAARFLYMEAINTVSSFYVIYLVGINAFTPEEAVDMIVRLIMIAVVSSVIAGFMVSKFGSKKVAHRCDSRLDYCSNCRCAGQCNLDVLGSGRGNRMLLGGAADCRQGDADEASPGGAVGRVLRPVPDVRETVRRSRTCSVGIDDDNINRLGRMALSCCHAAGVAVLNRRVCAIACRA